MIENRNKINFIQKNLQLITGKFFLENYIELHYLPLIQKLKNKKKVMIAGSQGSGKSSFSLLVKKFFKKFYQKDVVIISLDDFYHSQKTRLKLSKRVHPLYQTRGVPGTHDLDLMMKKITQIKKNQFPVYLPSFDKIKDSRKKNYKKIDKCDLLILEGWCVGAKPISNNFLKKNVNDLESKIDIQYQWRYSYNEFLKSYQALFSQFKFFIYFRYSNWSNILGWKYKQELLLRSISSDFKLKKYLSNFIQYYQKISMWMHRTSINDSNILIQIDQNQEIEKISYK